MPRPPGRSVDGHVARKRFGQNFLADPHYLARIADAVAPRPGDIVVEIGPGLGALTAALIARAGASSRSRSTATSRRGSPSASAARARLVVGDALAFDFRTLGRNLRVVGNLPYNISSPLLFRLADQAGALHDLTVMLQKEVVARMTAEPATPEYGRLTVMLQVTFAIERLFTVPPGAFRPPPTVDSAVARLVPLGSAAPRITDPARFARIVAAAFGQRRKTLRNALADVVPAAAFDAANVDPQRRGETLSVAEFVALADAAGAVL
ncbi:MAG: 16S rRNA (adenine(1518)-N(6)/adenine(1519)-N(6))-dimethyltransferase RsmA [Betaproteobacteria bacterium]|nr:16S rRNA (adenine(1518)-N(6)/adenine(1519)-N(6))-dimethyltransferase RsmA [Betaproteobacteria bacterium]